MSVKQNTKSLFIKTWGCQMNVYDSNRMADVLAPLGYQTVDKPDQADMIILNTCHIREKATDKVFSELGRLNRHKKARAEQGHKMIMAVAGCVAQAEGAFITERAPYVDMVFGPQAYADLPEMVAKTLASNGEERVIATDLETFDKFDRLPEESTHKGPSAYLSVQEGCDKFCTFCVVPYTRGAEYSRPVTAIVEEAKRLCGNGAMEISLLGQNVNAYHGEGPDGSIWSLAQLMRELAKIDGLKRLRYTTSHPRDMDQDLIDAHGELDIVMPFLHLPIQSGSDTILDAMNRKHTAEFYMDIIERLRKSRPDMAFSSDFIVGFPGETDENFNDTMAIVRNVGYASAYSFKYSARPGTPAAKMMRPVAEEIKDERLQRLQACINETQQGFNQSCVGLTLPVLFDRKGQKSGQLLGRSPYMQSVHAHGNDRLLGHVIPVRIDAAHANSLAATIETVEQVAC